MQNKQTKNTNFTKVVEPEVRSQNKYKNKQDFYHKFYHPFQTDQRLIPITNLYPRS